MFNMVPKGWILLSLAKSWLNAITRLLMVLGWKVFTNCCVDCHWICGCLLFPWYSTFLYIHSGEVDHHRQKTAERYNQDNEKEAKKAQKSIRPSALKYRPRLTCCHHCNICISRKPEVFFPLLPYNPLITTLRTRLRLRRKTRYFWLGWVSHKWPDTLQTWTGTEAAQAAMYSIVCLHIRTWSHVNM